MSGVWSLLLFVGAVYAALIVLLYVLQPRLIYFPNVPTRQLEQTPEAWGMAYESIRFSTDDKVNLDGWYLPAQDERAVLLFFHGNAGNISHRLDSLKIFHDLGVSVLIFDYRGYGRSEGKPSERGTYLDAEAAWHYLTAQRQVPPERVVLFGRSLGAAVATYLASQHTPGALILESAFTSVPELAAQLYPWLPARKLARFRYSTKEYLASSSCPVLLVHSRQDEIIPFENGRRLLEAANEPKAFLEIHGGHNDGFYVSGPVYVAGIDAFLRTHLGTDTPDS